VYEAKFIFDNRYCKSVYDFNGNQIAFAATIDYLNYLKVLVIYGRKVPTFPIMEALMVTSNQQVVTYEIGVYIDNQYMIQVFLKRVIIKKYKSVILILVIAANCNLT
jgi:hypothetical protein